MFTYLPIPEYEGAHRDSSVNRNAPLSLLEVTNSARPLHIMTAALGAPHSTRGIIPTTPDAGRLDGIVVVAGTLLVL